MGKQRRIVGEHSRHFTPEQAVDGGRDADEGEKRHVDVGRALEHLERDLQGRRWRAGHRQLAGLGARSGNEIGQALVGRRCLHNEHDRCGREIADRLKTVRHVIVHRP
jgi:hypothetical protein